MYNNDAIKIQINSVEAIERLIGGSSAIEIEVRNAVVQEFTKRHLKSLAEAQLYTPAMDLIKKELNEFAEKHVGSFAQGSNAYTKKIQLNQHMKDEIKREISAIISAICRKEVIEKANKLKEEIDFSKIKTDFLKSINTDLKAQLVKEVADEIFRRMQTP